MTQARCVGLRCPGCGANLDISAEMERLTCAYCGTEMMVERRGDDVAVREFADMLRAAHDGASKHAAEMALVRYAKELRELHDKRAAEEYRANRETGLRAVYAIIACGLGLILAGNGLWEIGLVFLLVALLAARSAWSIADQRDDSDIDARIVELMQLIKNKERIANS